MLEPIHKKNYTSSLKGKQTSSKKSKTSSSGQPSLDATAAETLAPSPDTFETALSHEQLKTNPVTPTRMVHPVAGTIDKRVIATLIGTLETQGELLSTDPSLKNYARYKSALQSLLETIMPKAYTIIKDYSPSTDTHTHKEYHIIGTVSQELTSLLTLIKETHQDKINIASKVNEIKGMLVDYIR